MQLPFVDQPNPMASWLLAGAAAVLIGISKSGIGAGVGIVAVPLFVFAVGSPTVAIGAMLPLLIAADIFSVMHHWGTWDRKNLRQMLPGSLVGIAAGSVLIWMLGSMDNQKRALEMAIGAICVLYPIADIIKAKFAPHWRLAPSYVGGSLTGASAGVVSTVAHAAGPVTAIYLLAQHQTKQAYIGTTVIYFFIVNTAKLLPYALLGLIKTDTLWLGLWLLPLIPVGTWLGAQLNRIASELVFRGLVLGVLVLTGLQMLGVVKFG